MTELQANDPQQAAWLSSFYDENHLHHPTSPDLVASPAQISFMVMLEPNQLYYPCSKRVYEEIMARVKSPILGEMYNQAWSRIFNLVEAKIDDPARRAFLLELLNIKYEHETANYNIIPSRLEKRLFKLFVVTTQIEDPEGEEKAAFNQRAMDLYHSESFIRAVNQPLGPHAPEPFLKEDKMESIRRKVDATKLRRLLQASVQKQFLESDRPPLTVEEWDGIFRRPISGNGWEILKNFILTPKDELAGNWTPRKILYLPDKAGEIVFDLTVIQFLIGLGHTVIVAVNNAPFYDMV
ncbi:MAG: ARMT1-like domain-containing protein [Thermodesulfobacteriota bacterium]|nr:ARMT1-like domain-containing protein [Thermodesulfobacteriota bacterium]